MENILNELTPEQLTFLKQQSWLNRQPTLWRHGNQVVSIESSDDDDDDTIGVSPLVVEPLTQITMVIAS